MTDDQQEKTLTLRPNQMARAYKSIRVLIAEDSATIRHHLVSVINEIPGVEVIGQARDGREAVQLVQQLRPDVVSMDIRMPHLDGFEATRQIMQTTPTPVVIVSALVENDMELSFQALESGALAVVEKPPDRRDPSFDAKQNHLIRTLVAMAKVSVVRRSTPATGPLPPIENLTPLAARSGRPEIVAIGASAGGPSALSKFLAALPADFPAPIAIVQHMPNEFIPGLARWLSKLTPLPVEIPADGAILRPGVVHLSLGTAHLRVERHGLGLRASYRYEQGAHLHQPAVDELFESVAMTCGARAIGIILTGMGDDGAAGLLHMRQRGAITLAQDKHSATVFGMPGAAIERGAVEQVVSLVELPLAVVRMLKTG